MYFPLPPDLLTLHELRRKWHETNIQKELLISMIDFADKFGANTVGIESGMEEVESIQETSNGLYLDQDYLGSLQQLELVISRIFELEELALELKDRALLWIYIIEWMSVFGTAIQLRSKRSVCSRLLASSLSAIARREPTAGRGPKGSKGLVGSSSA